MSKYLMFVVVLTMLAFPQQGMTQENIANYLILDDIGAYILKRESREFPDRKVRPITPYRIYTGTAGILNATGHFVYDHNDITYETVYLGGPTLSAPTVQVTQHAGSESDRWLLHEVEDGYRDGEMERLGLVTQGARVRDINGNKIISLRGSGYSWISNDVIIDISYTDLYGTKPEPLEVVQAYLQKFPSTIPSTLILDQSHNEKWIKDEMDRRLWLCDKWFFQLQLQKEELKTVLQHTVDSMQVFLDYREKYYGISATDEKKLLWEYLQANNGTAIKNKLAEYKSWWSENKEKAIDL